MEVLPPQQVPGQTDCSNFLPHQRRTLTVYGIQRFCVFSETIAVRYACLFNQPLDVLIQGIQLSLHHKNDGDQFFSAAVIQFFQCMSAIVPLLKLFSLYQKTQRIANRHPRRFASFFLCL